MIARVSVISLTSERVLFYAYMSFYASYTDRVVHIAGAGSFYCTGFWGVASTELLSYRDAALVNATSFSKLHDLAAWEVAKLSGVQPLTTKSNVEKKISAYRASAPFFNKFMNHGRQARSLKYYAESMAALLIALKNNTKINEEYFFTAQSALTAMQADCVFRTVFSRSLLFELFYSTSAYRTERRLSAHPIARRTA